MTSQPSGNNIAFGTVLLALLRAAEEDESLDRGVSSLLNAGFASGLAPFFRNQDHFERWLLMLRKSAQAVSWIAKPESGDQPSPHSIDPDVDQTHGPPTLSFKPGDRPGMQPTLADSSCGRKDFEEFQLPGYEIFEELGRGGMGIVYRALQVRANRVVALKVLRGGSQASPADKVRFHHEAEAVARLQHHNVVQIYEVSDYQGVPFFSFEYCDRGSLAERLDGTPWPTAKAAQLVEALARAVQVAHEHHIIHRDLKPANVLFRAMENGEEAPNDSVRVADFGLAKLMDVDSQTKSNAIVGTPSYMAPEQAGGKARAIGPATDVYALGAILYELLTGRPPFKGATAMDTMMEVIESDVVPPARLQPRTPRDLETICLKCLHKEPDRRYASASALADDLRRFQTGEPITARPVGRFETALKWVKRRPALATLIAAALLAVIGVAGLAVWFNVYLTNELATERETVLALKEAEQRQQHLASLREDAGKLVAQGNSALEQASQLIKDNDTAGAQREFQTARDRFAAAAEHVASETALAELHQEAERRREQASRGARIRDQIVEFEKAHDQALFNLTRFSGRDPTVDLEDAKTATRRALDVFGVAAGEDRGPVLDEKFLSAAEIARIRHACYELLVTLATATATPPRGKDAADPKKLEEAIGLLDRAAKLSIRSRSLHARKARYLGLLGRNVDANREQRESLDIEPSTAVDHFLLGEDDYAEGRYEEAIRHFETVLRQEPEHFWGRYYKALCHMRADGSNVNHLHAAGAALTVCISKRPGFAWSYLLRAFVHSQLQAFPSAESDFAMGLTHGLTPLERYALHVNRGAMRAMQRNFGEGIEDLRAAIKLQPEQYHPYLNLARIYQTMEKPNEAQPLYDRAVQLANSQPEPYRLRADFRAQQNNVAGALDDLNKAIQLEKQRRSPRLARDLVEKARLLQELGQLDPALEACQQAVQANPRHLQALLLQGSIYLKKEKANQALVWLNVYLGATPTPAPRAYLFRGIAYARQGEKAKALEDFNQLVFLEPQDPEAYLHRGEAYMKDKAYDLAKRDFDRAIDLKSDYAEAYNGRALLQAGYKDFHYQDGVGDALKAVQHGSDKWLVAYNAARAIAVASVRAQNDAAQQLEKQYRLQAIDMLRKALRLAPESQRRSVWEKSVLKEPIFNSLHDTPGFRELQAEYGAAAGPGR